MTAKERAARMDRLEEKVARCLRALFPDDKKPGRPALVHDKTRVVVLAKTNPHRQNTKRYAHFESIRDGMTIFEYVNHVGGNRQDLYADADKGHVEFFPQPDKVNGHDSARI
jgi:hypothetical protein